MNKLKIYIYIAVVVIIIAFGQYQKSQLEIKVNPVVLPVKKEKVLPPAKVNNTQIVRNLPKSALKQESEPEKIQQQVETKTESLEIPPTTSQVITNHSSSDSEKIVQDDTLLETNKSPPIVVEEVKLPEIELYMPEKANQTKEEKIAEIRSLVSIFKDHLTKMYQDREIEYIPKGNEKIGILLGDSIEYYEDPVLFEKKSTSSFIKTTMIFIEDVQRLRREAHQRYLSKNPVK